MNEGSWLRAVKVLGLPTVAAVVFGWFLLVDVRGDQRDFKDQHAAMIVEQQNLARGVLKLADKQGETQMLQEKILGVMRVMCIQGATTQAERRACLQE